jgi:hypothetical protein
LQQAEVLADDSQFQAGRAAVRALWREFLGDPT